MSTPARIEHRATVQHRDPRTGAVTSHDVVMTIDVLELWRHLSHLAVTSKTGRAVVHKGAVKARRIGARP